MLDDAIIFILYSLPFQELFSMKYMRLCPDSYITGKGNGFTHGNFLHAKSNSDGQESNVKVCIAHFQTCLP